MRRGDCGSKGSREQVVCSGLGPNIFPYKVENILPPCPASSDGSDQEGDENDMSDKVNKGDKELLYRFDILDFYIS